MATGLTIRDFFKEYRELRYNSSGSIRLSEIEHNAYVNRLTVEITHYDAPRAQNFKTLPENTHWGYLTAFKGSSVISNTPVKFVKQRMMDITNRGIWDYHQEQENISLLTNAIKKAGDLAFGELSTIYDGVGFPGFIINAIEGLETITEPAFAWVIGELEEEIGFSGNVAQNYTPFPIASPFPDVLKFQTDIPASFLFRLESWYLVNPAVYIVANPTDSGDATEGEDEYPSPIAGDGDGDGGEFPTPSPADPLSDPRDGGGGLEPEIDPVAVYTWAGTLSGVLLGSDPPGAKNYADPISFQAQGNQFPFTAFGGQSTIIVFGGESWGAGVNVFDRFGQIVFTYAPNVGFRKEPHTVNVTVQL